MKFSLHVLIAIATILLFSACDPEEIKQDEGFVELSIGSATLKTELAISREDQTRGLMYRDSMPEDHAMLFIFSAPQRMSFWMRNTRIPLDIGYFTADGILREVYPLYPFDENSRRSIREDLVYALETNQGWFSKNGVKVGDKLDLNALK